MPIYRPGKTDLVLEFGDTAMRINTLAKMILAGTLVALPLFAQQSALPSVNSQAMGNFGRLPLTFEANGGQTAGQVKFLSRGHGYVVFLTSGGMTVNLRATGTEAGSKSGSTASQKRRNVTLQFRLVGANQNPQVVGEDLQPGQVNYFIGKDPSKWHTNLPTYGKVRYKNVYPGIDLLYYGNHQQLEYDFAVAPGADPRQIQFEIKGAKHVELDQKGQLALTVNGGTLHFQSPVVYQESNGHRVPVVGGYAIKDPTHIGFEVSDFDSSKPLVIDPVLEYSTYLGGSGTDQPTGIAVDNSGNVYVAGYTDSPDFPLAAQGSLATGIDHVFVSKLGASGYLIYADYIGGNNDDYAVGLALDSANEVYVTGATQSNNFPLVNAYQSQQPGPYTGFLTRISADGAALLYSTYLGGNNSDQPSAIAIDGSDEVLVAGYTQSQNFPVTNAYQSTALANQGGIYGTYGFLTKFSADDSHLVYSTYFAGNTNVEEGGCCWVSPYSSINTVAADANGNAYVAGATNTYNFPVTNGSFLTSNTTALNANIGFVSKFNSAGELDYSTYFYGSSGYPVSIAAIGVDGSGSAYITGSAYSDSTFPVTSTSICDPGNYGLACGYAFVTKFNSAGSALTYSTFLGPNNYATPQAIALDANQDAYVLASASSSAFEEINGIEPYDGGSDVLLVEVNPAGTAQTFATYIGGSSDDQPAGIALDSDGNMYVAGWTDSHDFPVTQGAFQNLLPGNGNVFVAKIRPVSAPSVALFPWSLQFASQSVGSTSSAQNVLLRNVGSAALSIASIAVNGDFAETDTCNGSVPAAGSCTISVTFTPSAQGARSGSIVIEDNAQGAPHTIALYGVGEGGGSGSLAPCVALQPTALAFSSVPVGRSSTPQSVTLTNAGNASLNINNIQIAGDYSQTNTCPSSLAAGTACTISVIFTPTAQGTRTGGLTISDNAQGSPQTVILTGTGTAGTLVVAPSSLTFSNVQIGSTSSQAVILTNTGNAPVSVNGLQITGDYSVVNNCPNPISGGANCTIMVVFAPTTIGIRTGTLTVTSGIQATQQTVSLSGTGVEPNLVVSPTALAFSTTPLGTSSTVQALTLTNSGNASLSLTNLQVTGDYKPTNNCPATLSAGSNCTVNVVFTPSTTGSRSGNLTITDSAGTPQTVTLSGTGVDFSLSASPNGNTVQPGSTAIYTLTVSAIGGSFPDAISLSCGGLPKNASCSFSPTSVTPAASKATTTLSISTTKSVSENLPTAPMRQKPVNALWAQLQGLGVVGMVLARGKKRARKALILALFGLVALGMLFMSGCAGGTGIAAHSTNPQSYTITVTGKYESLQHSVPVTLTIE